MTLFDDRDDARTGEALSRALDALAGVGAAAVSPDALLGTVRSRVRRRRAVKQAGIGATTLAASGALVVGALQLRPTAVGPAVPVPPSPTETATPTPPATQEPTPPVTQEPTPQTPAAECSAAGKSTDADLSGLTPEAQETARALLAAAVACDADALVALAERDGTHFNFGTNDPRETWDLPGAEADDPIYEQLRRMLTQTTWTVASGQAENDTFKWPLVAQQDGGRLDDDAAWQEAVDALAVPEEFVQVMRENQTYHGLALGITRGGTWLYFGGGD